MGMVTFSPETATRVCEHLAEGKSLRQIAKLPDMPSKTSVLNWLLEGETIQASGDSEHPKVVFLDQYARAREMQADALFDECLDIADDTDADSFIDKDGNIVYKVDHIQRMRLRIDARKWMVGKLAPKKYADRTYNENKNEHSGPNGGPIVTADLSKVSDDKLAAAHALLFGGSKPSEPAE